MEAALRAVQIFPNPSLDRQVQVIVPAALIGSTYQLLSATGQNVQMGTLISEKQVLRVPQAGVFFLQIQASLSRTNSVCTSYSLSLPYEQEAVLQI